MTLEIDAAVCREARTPVVLERLTISAPGPNDVRVRISACAICQSDLHFLDGGWPDPLPAVYGHEAAGTVEAVGREIDDLAPGDAVMVTLIRSCGGCPECQSSLPYLCSGNMASKDGTRLRDANGDRVRIGISTGAFAEFAVVDRSQVLHLPSDLPLAPAALLSCGVITGYGAVANVARPLPGSSVVVIGCGGVGMNAIQAASIAGAEPVVAVDPSAEKRALAPTFGAHLTIDPSDGGAVDSVMTATGGRGAEAVIVTAGVGPAVEMGFTILARNGTLVLVGMPPSGVTAHLDPGALAGAGQRIVGCKMGSTVLPRDLPVLFRHYLEGRLKLDELITGRYPFQDINAALNAARRGKGLRNVLIF